jgi:hypothetical protein
VPILKSPNFGLPYNPGVRAQYSGIYKCTACDGYEIACAAGDNLPAAMDRKHEKFNCVPSAVQWQLVAEAIDHPTKKPQH